MKQIVGSLLSLVLFFVVAAPLAAADTKRKTSDVDRLAAAQLKKLAKADLTAEQVTKVKVVAKYAEKRGQLLKNFAYTPEQKKAYAEAYKKAKAEGKTGKELSAAMKAAIKLTPQQESARKGLKQAYDAMMKEIVGMLTDEQKAKLPRKSSRSKKTG